MRRLWNVQKVTFAFLRASDSALDEGSPASSHQELRTHSKFKIQVRLILVTDLEPVITDNPWVLHVLRTHRSNQWTEYNW